jgi:hypothetical protein
LGAEARAAAKPPADITIDGYATVGSSMLALPAVAVEAYEASAYAAVQATLASTAARAQLIPCKPTGPADEACLGTVLERVGSKAFRRALTAPELDTWKKVGRAAATAFSNFDRGVEFAVAGLLQSPNFLYVAEQGEPDAKVPGAVRYTSVEMASRLSFFLLGTTPPEALLAVARNNGLSTADQVRAQALALLELPQARAALNPLFQEWLDLEGVLDGGGKDSKAFPTFNTALAKSMIEETTRFLGDIAFDSKRNFHDILDARFTYVDKALAAHYGLAAPTAAGFTRVELPANGPRGGVLTQAAFLSAQAHPIEPSPTLRGKLVRERLLCQAVPEPPPDVPIVLEDPPPNSEPRTLRERLNQHMTDPTCRGCHQITDPIGFGFQNFDAIGRFRTTELNRPIDASGSLDTRGNFTDARGFSVLLKGDPRLTSCITRTAFRFAAGHIELDSEDSSLDAVERATQQKGFNFKAWLAEIAASDAFRFAKKP